MLQGLGCVGGWEHPEGNGRQVVAPQHTSPKQLLLGDVLAVDAFGRWSTMDITIDTVVYAPCTTRLEEDQYLYSQVAWPCRVDWSGFD